MTVSVIIPTYRRQAMLERAVASVKVADPSAEIVVVDDASPEPIEPPKGTQFVRREVNGGAAAARNTGVQVASGDVLAFVDSDDVWHPDRLLKTLPVLEMAPIVTCWASWHDETRPTGRLLHGNVADVIADATTPPVGATTLRREVWVPFDETYRTCQDIEWWTRLAAGAEVRTVADSLYLIYRHPGERHLSGFDVRIRDSQRLLDTPYFRDHPRAAAFRYYRIGVMARALGDRRTSRMAFRQSLSLVPSARTAVNLARTFGPSGGAQSHNPQ